MTRDWLRLHFASSTRAFARNPNVSKTITFGSLVLAVVVSVVGLFFVDRSVRFELGVESFALVAAITGVFAERYAAIKEREDQAVAALAAELQRNGLILNDERFAPSGGTVSKRHVYPRVLISAADTALTSGVFADKRNNELVGLLHAWRDLVDEFNRRLDITELRMFVAGSTGDIESLDRGLHRENGYLDGVRASRFELDQYVRQHYALDSRVHQ